MFVCVCVYAFLRSGDMVCRRGVFVFLQAEDVIRDLVRSRGLGDVYKRQQYWVRSLKMFLEDVEIDGQNVPRFEWVRKA